MIAANDEAIPAPLLSWGYNNEMCHFERTAPTSYPTRIQYFLGPGDRFVSARPGGQTVQSQNKYATESAQARAQKSSKDFLGPGDKPLLGTAERNMEPDQDDDKEIGGNRIV